jgi:hypothetical protein
MEILFEKFKVAALAGDSARWFGLPRFHTPDFT